MTLNTVINAFASAALDMSQWEWCSNELLWPSQVQCPASLHVCHKSENFVKLNELPAYCSSRDYKVLVGEFSYACYRKWHFVQLVSLIVNAVEFLEVREPGKGRDHFRSLHPASFPTNQKHSSTYFINNLKLKIPFSTRVCLILHKAIDLQYRDILTGIINTWRNCIQRWWPNVDIKKFRNFRRA